MKAEVYQRVTDRIVELLEKGVRPWARPWKAGAGAAGFVQLARPLRHNGQPYTGVNVLNLWAAAEVRGFRSRYWMTFNKAKELGGSVRKGAKAEQAFFASAFKKEDEKTGEEKTIAFLKSYNVFNADEIEGLPAKFYAEPAPVVVAVPEPSAPEPLPEAEAFIAATGADVRHGGDKAFYSPAYDRIQMPPLASFVSAQAYYGVALHELAHWTMPEGRCDRKGGFFGDPAYAFEELVAELCSAFLSCDLGLAPEPREDHAAYIESWLRALKHNNQAIFRAASAAEKAARFLHGLQPKAEPAADDTEEKIAA